MLVRTLTIDRCVFLCSICAQALLAQGGCVLSCLCVERILSVCLGLTRLGRSGEREEIWSGSLWVGQQRTNNEAEYSGLIEGLRAAKEVGVKVGLVVRIAEI